MSVTKMRILRWMSDDILKRRIKNENIWDKLEVPPKKDKIR